MQAVSRSVAAKHFLWTRITATIRPDPSFSASDCANGEARSPSRGLSVIARHTLATALNWQNQSMCPPSVAMPFSSKAVSKTISPTGAVEELYQKIVKSIEARTMPPNAWLWSLIRSCSCKDDIKLLFESLQKLRIFRLSNLCIHDNFNSHLCMRVTEACARVGAVDYGLKALRKHNIYGLTPSIASAHYLLLHAKENKDTKLMRNILHVLQNNSLPLQPGTADIVFSICYSADRWDLLSELAKQFIEAGVKLRRTSFNIWMDFAAKIGSSSSIWKIDALRAKSAKKHTLSSGFACAKGFLLECKPEDAAATIRLLWEDLPESKRQQVSGELQKLISHWPIELIKQRKEEKKKGIVRSLETDIPIMVKSILNTGLDLQVSLEQLLPEKILSKD